MTRSPLLLAILAACLLAFAACGDDDDSPLGEGPADNVAGVWEGDYTSNSGPAGTYCLNIEQDGRSLTGQIAFNGGIANDMQGAIADNRLSFIWGQIAGVSTTPGALPTNIASSGTFSGHANAGTLDGTYSVTVTLDTGAFSGHRSEKRSC